MAIALTVLTSGSATGSAPWTTDSITPPSNVPVTCAVLFDVFGGGTLGTVSLSGCGLNWVEIDHVDFSTIASPTHRLTLFRSLGASPTTGAITISVTGGTTQKAAAWEVVKEDGADTSGTDGSGAVVQSAKNNTDGASSPNALTVTLAALSDATNNAVYAVFGDAEDTTLTPGTGYTELTDINDGAGQDVTLESSWDLPGTTTPSVSGASSFSDQGGIAIEIKAASGAATGQPYAKRLGGIPGMGISKFAGPKVW